MPRYIEGFERGYQINMMNQAPQSIGVGSRNKVLALDPTATPPVDSDYCLYFDRAGSATYKSHMILNTPLGIENTTELYVKFRFQTTRVSGGSTIFSVGNESNTAIISLSSEDGNIRVNSYCSVYDATEMVSSYNMIIDKWYIIEFYVSISPGACSASPTGSYELRIDGIVEAKEDNVRTGGGYDYYNTVLFSCGYNRVALMDDIVIDTTSAFDITTGDSKVYLYKPNANGTNSDFIPSSGQNYECVDVTGKLLNVDDNYISSNQVADKDSYTLTTDSTSPMTKIVTVQSEHRVERVGRSVPRSIKPYLLIGGFEYTGDDFPSDDLGVGSPRAVINEWRQNPNTLTDWVEGDLSSLELGIETDV